MSDERTAADASAAQDEAQLFDALCEMTPEAQRAALARIASTDTALAARLGKLLAIDADYADHTARSVGAEALHEAMPEVPPHLSEIGAFRVLRRIGSGGMGVVFLAERRSGFAQQVAIKLMPAFAADAAGRARFAQERQILAQLRHPHICSILDGGETADGTPYLAMEYLRGESLCAWCARTGAGLRERIALMLQLCEAVQYAHRNLVVHRDIKDGNVLVDDAGHLKLLDFGIAKSLDAADLEQTAFHDRVFSPMTAAPEQLRGERVGVAVDVYALGALLHQLLCGFLPFEKPARDVTQLQRDILETVPPRMSDALRRAGDAGPVPERRLRGELDAIVAQCLRKDPAERYAEVGELARDLRAWSEGRPISISADDRLYRIGKFLRRHRLPATLAALTALSVLGALGLSLWQAAQLRTERDAAEAARERSERDRDRARAVAGFVRDTFEQADPAKAAQGGLLARDLIERGRRKLDGLRGEPDVQAELALLLAESYASMGLSGESQALLRDYDAPLRALAAVDAAQRWRTLRLALALRLELEADSARNQQDLTALERLAHTPMQHVEAAMLRERLHAKRSDYAAAVATLEGAWQRYGAQLSADDALRLRLRLGAALFNADRRDDALRLAQRIDAADLDQRDAALQIRALRFIARAYGGREDMAQAQAAAIQRWQDTAERLYGSDSLEAASAAIWRVGVTEDAPTQEQLIARAYAIQRQRLPPQTAGRAHAEYNVADFWLSLRDDPQRALPHLRQAVASGRSAYSRGHSDVRKFELRLARTLNRTGQHRETLAQLANPPLADNAYDAEQAGALHLALGEAALAVGDRALARRQVEAIQAQWRRLRTAAPLEQESALTALAVRIGDGRPSDSKTDER